MHISKALSLDATGLTGVTTIWFCDVLWKVPYAQPEAVPRSRAFVVFIMRPVSIVVGSMEKPIRNTSYDFVLSIYSGS